MWPPKTKLVAWRAVANEGDSWLEAVIVADAAYEGYPVLLAKADGIVEGIVQERVSIGLL